MRPISHYALLPGFRGMDTYSAPCSMWNSGIANETRWRASAQSSEKTRFQTLRTSEYPYPVFRAAFHPFDYGQGFPTMLMIPGTDQATMYTYQFIAHETSHQWWG